MQQIVRCVYLIELFLFASIWREIEIARKMEIEIIMEMERFFSIPAHHLIIQDDSVRASIGNAR